MLHHKPAYTTAGVVTEDIGPVALLLGRLNPGFDGEGGKLGQQQAGVEIAGPIKGKGLALFALSILKRSCQSAGVATSGAIVEVAIEVIFQQQALSPHRSGRSAGKTENQRYDNPGKGLH